MFKEITDPKEYRKLIEKGDFTDYHFAQSAQWFNLKRESGSDQRAFVLFRGDTPVLLGQVAPQKVLRNKNCWLMTFGPIASERKIPSGGEMGNYLNGIKAQAAENGIVFVQVNPFSFNTKTTAAVQEVLAKENLLAVATNPIRHTEGTIVFNVNELIETSLLPKFRDDVKYNLKRALRDNLLTIRESTEPNDFEKFWALYADAQRRIGFQDNRKALYELMLKRGEALIWLAELSGNNKLHAVSAVFAVKFAAQKTLITFLSATSDEGNKLRAPTLLRYRIFEWAHSNGFSKVDFFSVRKEKTGFTQFKMGFGGDVTWYPEPQVLIVDPFWYRLYSIYHSLFGKKASN